MDKYIKANELVDRVIESKNYNPHENPLQRQNHIVEHRHFITMIDSMKAEEVVPAKYGTWRIESDEEEPNPMFKLAVCSACNEKSNTTYKYCPNCGANMITPIKLRTDWPEAWEPKEFPLHTGWHSQ
jgi:hydrogenase maturation factor HypF (carbamoyltransferase family)